MFRAVSVELDPAVSDRVPNIADRLEEFRTKYNIEVGKSQGKNYWVRGNLAQLQLVQEELESLQEDVEQVAKDTNDESNSRRHDSLDDQNLNTPISSNRAEEENEGLKKYDERTSLGHEHVQTQLTEDGNREEALNVIHTPNAINNVQDIEQPPHQIQEDDANISQGSCHQEQPEEKEDFLDEIPSDDEPDIKHQSLSSDRLDDTNTSNQEKGGQSLDNGEIIIEAQGIVSSVNPDGVQSLVNEDKNKPSENGKLSKTESVKSGLGRHVDDVMLSSTQSDKSGLDPHVDDVMLSPTQSDSDDFLCPFDDDDDDDDNRQKEDGDLVNIEDEQPMAEIKNNSQGKSFLDTTVNNMPSEHSSILAEEDGLAPGSKPTDTSTDASTNAVDKIDSANQEEDNALTTVSNKEPDRSTPPIPPEPKEMNSYSIYGDENWDEDDEDDIDDVVYAKDGNTTRGNLATEYGGSGSTEKLDTEHGIKPVLNAQYDQGISAKDVINTEQSERAPSPEAGDYPTPENDTTEKTPKEAELTENMVVDTFLMEFIKDYHSDKLDRIQTQFGVDFDFMVEGECTEIRLYPADGRNASSLSLSNARATLGTLYEGVMESIIKTNIEYDPSNINKESMEYTIQSIVMSLGMDHPVKICDDGHGMVVVIGSQSDAAEAANQLKQNLSMEPGDARRVRTEFQMSSAMNKLVMVMQGKDKSGEIAKPSATLTLIEENSDSEAKPTIAALPPVPIHENVDTSEDTTVNLTEGTTMEVSETQQRKLLNPGQITQSPVDETYRKMETEKISVHQLEDSTSCNKPPDYNHKEADLHKIDTTKTEQRTEKENMMYDPFRPPELHHSSDTTTRDQVTNNTMHGVSEMQRPWQTSNKSEPQVTSKSAPLTEQETQSILEHISKTQPSSKTAVSTIRLDKTDTASPSPDRSDLNKTQQSESTSEVRKTQTYHFNIRDDIRLSIAVDNLSKVHCDALIIPATQLLTHVGNLGTAITESAGKEFSDACDKKMEIDGELKLCDVTTTTGGKLQCQHVIHAVVPTWTDHREVLCTSKLQQTLLNAFNCANNELHARCVSLPPLGTGYYMYPVDTFMGELFKALHTLSQTRTVKYIEDVKLVDLSQTTVNLMAQIFMEHDEFEKQTAEAIANSMPVTTDSHEMGEKHENLSKNISSVPRYTPGSSEHNPAVVKSSSQERIPTIPTGATSVPSPEANHGPPSSSGIKGLTELELNNSSHSDATAEKLSESIIGPDAEIPAPFGTEHGRSPTNSKTNDEYDEQINREIFSNISNLSAGRSAHHTNINNSDSDTHKTTGNNTWLPTEVNNTSQSVDLFNQGTENGGLINGQRGEATDTSSPPTADTNRAESVSIDDRLVPDKTAHGNIHAVDATPNKNDSNKIVQEELYHNRHNEDRDNKSSLETSSDTPSGVSDKTSGKTADVFPPEAGAGSLPDVNESDKPDIRSTQDNNAKGMSATEDTRDESLQCDFDDDKARSMIGQHQSGKMTWEIDRTIILPGHEDTPGAVVITYKIPKGTIRGVHGGADIAYKAGSGKAFLPNSPEGRSTVQHLKLAFEAGLTFTVDMDSGRIRWGDIPHKKRTTGGPAKQGYPDPGYIQRLREVLKEKKLICFE